MTKSRKPIQTHEKFFIEQNPDSLSVAELAKMFGRTEQVVRNIIAKYKIKQGTNKVTTKKVVEVPVADENNIQVSVPKSAPKSNIQVQPLMGKAVRNGQTVATVMTQAAAEAGDEARKANKRPISATLQSAIHNCKTN